MAVGIKKRENKSHTYETSIKSQTNSQSIFRSSTKGSKLKRGRKKKHHTHETKSQTKETYALIHLSTQQKAVGKKEREIAKYHTHETKSQTKETHVLFH